MATISTTTTLVSKSNQSLTKKRVKMATTQRSKKATTSLSITITKVTPMMQINSHTVRIKISTTQTVLMLSLKRLAMLEADYGQI